MRAHIRSYAIGKRHAIEVDLIAAGKTSSRKISDNLNAKEFAAMKVGLQAGLLLANYAVSSKHQVLTEERR